MNARLLIVLAAVLWSLSGFFTRLFDSPWLGLNEPPLSPLQRAAGRALFAGLILLPLIRPHQVRFTGQLGATALAFTLMNASYITAMTWGTSGSVVLLQYTAPLWIFLVSVLLWGETLQPRDPLTLVLGMVGIGFLLIGGWTGNQLPAVGLATVSGVFFGLVLLGLRVQRDQSPVWITVVNLLCAGLALLPFILFDARPTLAQLGVLALFGGVQLGLPYILTAYASRYVKPTEAAMLMLVEPILVPVWACLVDPERERPDGWMVVGGLSIVGSLAYRYWPRRGNPGDERASEHA
ncbi:MAG: DMT family transporter [Gemmataceae bacterium]